MMKTPLLLWMGLLAWLGSACLGFGQGTRDQTGLDVRVWNVTVADKPLTIAVNSICSARLFTYTVKEPASKSGTGSQGDAGVSGTESIVEGLLSGTINQAAKMKDYNYTILNVSLLTRETFVFFNKAEKSASSDSGNGSKDSSGENAVIQFLREHTKDDLIRVWRETGAKDAETAALGFFARKRKEDRVSNEKIGNSELNPWIELNSAAEVRAVYDSLIGVWLGGTPPVHMKIDSSSE